MCHWKTHCISLVCLFIFAVEKKKKEKRKKEKQKKKKTLCAICIN